MSKTEKEQQFPLGNYCDADERVKAMDFRIRPLADAMSVTGPAFTVSSPPGQNLAIHRAIAEAHPGDVLVVETSGDCRFGPFGEILALACQHRAIAGLDHQRHALAFGEFDRGSDQRWQGIPGALGDIPFFGTVPAPQDLLFL